MDEETQEETQEETSEQAEEATSSSEEEPEGSDLAEQLELERKAKQQLTARAKKAEARLKEVEEKYKSSTETAEEKTASPDVDERVLKANGMSDDLLKELKAVAQVRGVGLIEAQADPVFQGIKENYEKETKAKEASLGASKGSGQAKPKKSFTTPNLSRDEHKELFKQRFK